MNVSCVLVLSGARLEKAKSMQYSPSSCLFSFSAVMPALDPSGRAISQVVSLEPDPFVMMGEIPHYPSSRRERRDSWPHRR
jgi:hypothetical protein